MDRSFCSLLPVRGVARLLRRDEGASLDVSMGTNAIHFDRRSELFDSEARG